MRWMWLIFWGVAGLVMLVSSFWVEWFDIDFTWFKLNLGWFALVYAGLLALRNVFLTREIEMTPRELHDFGQALEHLTPEIIARVEAGKRPREVARELSKAQGIPELVLLKYMVALGKEMRRQKEEEDGE